MARHRNPVRIAVGGFVAVVIAGMQAIAASAPSTVRPNADRSADRSADLAAGPHHYWLAFAENYGDDIRLSLHIDAPAATRGSVDIPGVPFSARFEAGPDATTVIDLPIEAMVTPGAVSTLGVRVRAEAAISLRGLNRRPSSSDAFLALPVSALGRDYRALGYTQLRPDQPSQLLVVATEDGTRVSVAALGDCPAAEARLNRGQTWAYGCADVSGLSVSASAPIAVFAGARCAEIPLGSEFCSHLVEQLPPISAWGRRFAVLPLATRKASDRVRIVAHEDDTEVRINGELTVSLTAGTVHQFTVQEPSLIETSKPALVAQYAASSAADGVAGDPFMVLVPAVTQFAARQIVNALSPSAEADPESGPAFASHHVNLVLPAAAVASLRVDGQAVDAKRFAPIGDGSLHGATLPLTPGRHALAADAPFGAIVYGFGEFDAYGLPGGLIADPPAP